MVIHAGLRDRSPQLVTWQSGSGLYTNSLLIQLARRALMSNLRGFALLLSIVIRCILGSELLPVVPVFLLAS